MKKSLVIVLFGVFLLLIFSGGFVAAQDAAAGDSSGEGLWDLILKQTGKSVNATTTFIGEKVGWVFGKNTFSGEQTHFLSPEYWTTAEGRADGDWINFGSEGLRNVGFSLAVLLKSPELPALPKSRSRKF